jgi:hypothetical protein
MNGPYFSFAHKVRFVMLTLAAVKMNLRKNYQSDTIMKDKQGRKNNNNLLMEKVILLDFIDNLNQRFSTLGTLAVHRV